MISSIGSPVPIDLLAQAAGDPAAAAAQAGPAPGERLVPVPAGRGPSSDVGAPEAEEAARQAAETLAKAVDGAAAAADSNPAAHPNEVHLIRDPESGMVAVQIRDAVTGDELSQIPSDKMIKTMASINENIGLLLDEKS